MKHKTVFKLNCTNCIKNILLGGVMCFLMLTLFATKVFAVTESSASDELFKLLNNTVTMRADFSQAVLAKSGARVQQKVAGKMALQRPGKFRWETLQPTHQLIIANGHYAWVYDVDLEQATKQTLDEQQLDSPAHLLSGSSDTLRRIFSVKRLAISRDDIDNDSSVNDDKNVTEKSTRTNDNDANSVYFELRPKTSSGMYSLIRLLFVDGVLRRMVMEDNLGQRNEFNFTNVKLNQTFASNLFTFTTPRGVDVIDNTQDN